MRYAIIIERSENGYAAHVPDLPGVVATADTVDACKLEIEQAVRFHLEGMREDNIPIPEPTSLADYVAA